MHQKLWLMHTLKGLVESRSMVLAKQIVFDSIPTSIKSKSVLNRVQVYIPWLYESMFWVFLRVVSKVGWISEACKTKRKQLKMS